MNKADYIAAIEDFNEQHGLSLSIDGTVDELKKRLADAEATIANSGSGLSIESGSETHGGQTTLQGGSDSEIQSEVGGPYFAACQIQTTKDGKRHIIKANARIDVPLDGLPSELYYQK